ncbi:eamA-like transporter family domain-containing protein [Hirsutella rhossiliensis]|uniref:EamA-like transporter family domain-containing protein n=1 Tax=Hirsutella rhossiliensis TaxID=111463 RepID=A0A9P8N2J0_9HYPO|nr:eamA-like transporter family domain-containing protein [Hirsutella rhossiliensis]KAH0967088.1 eamA-like transporter family domain-containing protein [Hirsutella rhossiliensis]
MGRHEALELDQLRGFGQPRPLPHYHPLSPGSHSDSKTQHATPVRESPSPSPSRAPGAGERPSSPHGCSSPAWRRISRCTRFWALNRPALLVALSQLFGACMNLCARLLELEGEGMHPVQVLFVRQGLTAVCCLLYMRWGCVPDNPFGRGDVSWLLLARSISGFFGIFCMWYSMLHLPLADATVITFLAPGLATVIALLGVVLIAQPAALFSPSAAAAPEPTPSGKKLPNAVHAGATAQGRLLGVCVALLGAVGSAGAFTTLRALGRRVHPVTSINALAMGCTTICAAALALAPALDVDQPSLRWTHPTSTRQWLLMLAVVALGFAMQYLLTAGLAADTSNRANAMVYTHMLFAVAFDRWVLGHRMGLTSFLGCALILGSAVGVVVLVPKPSPQPPSLLKAVDVERQSNLAGEAERFPMLTATRTSGS